MANEKRLIDANALHASVSKKLMTDAFPNWKEFPRDVQEKLTRLGKEHERFLFEAPTVDSVEVVHGHWCWEGRFKACSKCGSHVEWDETLGAYFWKFCPYCGAKMDGDGNG